MAFTGTATVKQISDRIVRVTGLSLASGAAGVFMLHTAASPPGGTVLLPVGFQPDKYAYSTDGSVTLQDAIKVSFEPNAVGVATAIPVTVVKTGTSPTDFTITVTNTHGSLATPNLEFYIGFHD